MQHLVVNLLGRESDGLFGAEGVQVQRPIFALQLAADVGLPNKRPASSSSSSSSSSSEG